MTDHEFLSMYEYLSSLLLQHPDSYTDRQRQGIKLSVDKMLGWLNQEHVLNSSFKSEVKDMISRLENVKRNIV